MAANAPPATTKTTWIDWLGPDEPEPEELFTRDEIAGMASGIDPVTGDDIRYWEYQGVLPRSVRRRHKGATRAVYPAWYADLAKEVRRLQRKGQSLDEIRPQIHRPITHPLSAHITGTSHVTANLTTHTRTVPQTAAISVSPSPPTELVSALNAFARDYAEGLGSPVAHIEVSISLENGSGSIFGIPIGEHTDSNSKQVADDDTITMLE